ncbi:hypothetical protein [Acetobacter fallax]|nr:hypothetical protein [Acetobacter fallax]
MMEILVPENEPAATGQMEASGGSEDTHGTMRRHIDHDQHEPV